MSLIDLPERIQDKIFVDCGSGCWRWIGHMRANGYGDVNWGGGPEGSPMQLAHRAVYRFFAGDLPKGSPLHHLCQVKDCVNPGHLIRVTKREHREIHIALKTTCRNGHEYTPENTYREPGGNRRCRACHRAEAAIYQPKYRARKRAERHG